MEVFFFMVELGNNRLSYFFAAVAPESIHQMIAARALADRTILFRGQKRG
jgi:hypothetical protein